MHIRHETFSMKKQTSMTPINIKIKFCGTPSSPEKKGRQMKDTKSTRGEKVVAASVFIALLFATGLDADNETSCLIAAVGAVVCLLITMFGMWLMWLDEGRAESKRRVEQMRRASKIDYKDRQNKRIS